MTKRLLWMLGSLGLLAAVSGLAPVAFRQVDAFGVQRVEVAGARYLSPDAVVDATGISDSSNVFDDADEWHHALRQHSLVAGVRVERRPPHTLRFHVREAQPVVLAPVPELVAVDGEGRVLPIETAGSRLDLPVLVRRARIEEDSLLDEVSRQVIAGLVAVRTLDAQLAATISEIAPAGGGGIRLVLERGHGVEVLLPAVPDARGLLEVRLALDHLRSTRAIAGDEDAAAGATAKGAAEVNRKRRPDDVPATQRVRIDARYRDELFVTLEPRRTS
ncbi:MAG: cell division protein FtsQ/DivIB [Longimicrobiales bacterium]